jgi:Tfp pilus assembly protein PilN
MSDLLSLVSNHPVISAIVLLVGVGLIVCGAFPSRITRRSTFALGPLKVGYREERARTHLWLMVAGLTLVLLALIFLLLHAPR